MTHRWTPLLLGLFAWLPLSSFTPAQSPETVLYATSQPLTQTDESQLSLRTDVSCGEPSLSHLEHLETELRALRNVYSQTLGYTQAHTVALKGNYFCSETAYKAYQRHLGVRNASNTGFFSLSHEEIVVMGHHPEQGRQTLMHEASHALLRSEKAAYSKWINEGLAEYFEGASWQSNKGFQVHPQTLKDTRVKALLNQGELPPLKAYLDLSNPDWQQLQSPRPVGSSIAWSLVYYLMENGQNHSILRQLLRDQQAGMSTPESLETHYPGGLAQLEKDWHRFIFAKRSIHNWQGFA